MHLGLVVQVIAAFGDVFSALLALPDVEGLALLDLFERVEVFLLDKVALDAAQRLAGGDGVDLLWG
jgi:hypothetical protein